ncbi:hypothetical protein ACJMK2_000727 [Sinanodonta woodiana]|uniref:Uncharacterized protein n=1 Tax=Sinanodonta woodiana TaxID=1069815 RepID=A0ABD3XQL7_SINWO
MASIGKYPSIGKNLLKSFFRTEVVDSEEGRLIHAFRDQWAQAIDLSTIAAKHRPNTPSLLALIIAIGIDSEELETFTHIVRGGGFLIYPRCKAHLLPMGNRQIGAFNFPCEIPLTNFTQGFEERLQIKALNVRRETYKALANVNTGKIIVPIDARDAPKIPEFFKIGVLLVQSWFFGCIHVRPCCNCSKTGRDKWKCPKQGTTTDNTKQQQQQTTQNVSQNNETTPKSYAESVKAHSVPPEKIGKNLFGKEVAQDQVQGKPSDYKSPEIPKTNEEEKWVTPKRKRDKEKNKSILPDTTLQLEYDLAFTDSSEEENKEKTQQLKTAKTQVIEEMETDSIEKVITKATTPVNNNKNKKKQNKDKTMMKTLNKKLDKSTQPKNPEPVYPKDKEEIIEPHNDKEKNSKKTTKSNSTTHNASTQEEEHNLDSEPIKPDGNIKIQERNSEMEQTQPKRENIK